MHDFRRLEVWNDGLSIAMKLYGLTESFPAEERYGLKSQIRRAAVSISSNIAEGAARSSPRDMARFLRHALGSIAEIETQVELSHRLGFLEEQKQLAAELDQLRRRIRALHDHVLASS